MEELMKDRTWSYNYDDSEIDDIIWSEIESSLSMGDFVCYVVHKLSNAKYSEEAKSRAAARDKNEDPTPVAYPRAIARIRLLAESGNATAMFHMGKIHAFGIATERDLSLAIDWYEKAVECGDPRASSNLGWFYQSGTGVTEDKKKAFRLLSHGAESGMVVAGASVGMMRILGEGCEQDVVLGLRMLEEAFDAGYLNAGNHLSDLYFAGEHVHQDIDLAHDWLLRAAQRGDAKSMATLGHHLVTGSRGKQDYEQGMKLLGAALVNGFVTAYLWIGGLYRDGRGVERDLEKAAVWFAQGAEAGDMQCAFALASLDATNVPDTGVQ